MQEGTATKERRVRDLKGQLADLDAEDEGEWLFMENSPARKKVALYSMLDGEKVMVPKYMAGAALGKRLTADEGGGFMFTDNPKEAPEYVVGDTKCFMHPESPERAVLAEIGLGSAFCPAAQLGGVYSRRMHGMRRHSKEWAAYQEYVDQKKEDAATARQEAQLEATLALARGNMAPVEEVVDCDQCNYAGTKRQVTGHKMGAHK